MPHELIKVYDDMVNINLKDFFGFCLAEIECPKNIIPRRPLLIHKHNGKVIHSTGRWVDVYFSEELKAVESQGYKITLDIVIKSTKLSIRKRNDKQLLINNYIPPPCVLPYGRKPLSPPVGDPYGWGGRGGGGANAGGDKKNQNQNLNNEIFLIK